LDDNLEDDGVDMRKCGHASKSDGPSMAKTPHWVNDLLTKQIALFGMKFKGFHGN